MAKTVYERSGEKLVDETIDEIILRILGLEDVYDLDYDEYKSLLKEAMTIGRMNSTKMASSETEKLTDEYKRIKRKTISMLEVNSMTSLRRCKSLSMMPWKWHKRVSTRVLLKSVSKVPNMLLMW